MPLVASKSLAGVRKVELRPSSTSARSKLLLSAAGSEAHSAGAGPFGPAICLVVNRLTHPHETFNSPCILCTENWALPHRESSIRPFA
jgi:hypothetical protein